MNSLLVSYISIRKFFLRLKLRDTKKVSVIVPSYNYAKFLDKRMLTILRQSYPIYEIIILDDASTDNSREIIAKYEKKYPQKIKSVFNTVNSGSAIAQWAKGFSIATGEYIWIAEADDLAASTFLETLVKKMSEDKDILIGYTQSKIIEESGAIFAENCLEYTNDVDPEIWKKDYVSSGSEEIEKRFSVKNTISNVSAVVFRNGDYEEYLKNLINYKIVGDWLLYINILKDGGKIFYSAKTLNYHRYHGSSITEKIDKEVHCSEVIEVQEYVYSLTGNNEYLQKAKEYVLVLKNAWGLAL